MGADVKVLECHGCRRTERIPAAAITFYVFGPGWRGHTFVRLGYACPHCALQVSLPTSPDTFRLLTRYGSNKCVMPYPAELDESVRRNASPFHPTVIQEMQAWLETLPTVS